MLQELFGTQLDLPARIAVAAAVIAVLLGLTVVIVRKLSSGGSAAGPRGRQARLAVLDSVPLDQRRKLVLVRRDEVEHLLLVGGAADIVVEQGIGRTAREAAPTLPRETTPAREALPLREPAALGRRTAPPLAGPGIESRFAPHLDAAPDAGKVAPGSAESAPAAPSAPLAPPPRARPLAGGEGATLRPSLKPADPAPAVEEAAHNPIAHNSAAPEAPQPEAHPAPAAVEVPEEARAPGSAFRLPPFLRARAAPRPGAAVREAAPEDKTSEDKASEDKADASAPKLDLSAPAAPIAEERVAPDLPRDPPRAPTTPVPPPPRGEPRIGDMASRLEATLGRSLNPAPRTGEEPRPAPGFSGVRARPLPPASRFRDFSMAGRRQRTADDTPEATPADIPSFGQPATVPAPESGVPGSGAHGSPSPAPALEAAAVAAAVSTFAAFQAAEAHGGSTLQGGTESGQIPAVELHPADISPVNTDIPEVLPPVEPSETEASGSLLPPAPEPPTANELPLFAPAADTPPEASDETFPVTLAEAPIPEPATSEPVAADGVESPSGADAILAGPGPAASVFAEPVVSEPISPAALFDEAVAAEIAVAEQPEAPAEIPLASAPASSPDALPQRIDVPVDDAPAEPVADAAAVATQEPAQEPAQEEPAQEPVHDLPDAPPEGESLVRTASDIIDENDLVRELELTLSFDLAEVSLAPEAQPAATGESPGNSNAPAPAEPAAPESVAAAPQAAGASPPDAEPAREANQPDPFEDLEAEMASLLGRARPTRL